MTTTLHRLQELVHLVSMRRHGLIGMAVVRVALGAVILLDLAIHASARHELWGAQGWYTHAHLQRDQQLGVSLFNLSSEPWMTDVLYAAYAAAAVLFLLGWRTALVTPVLLLLVWTFQERNPYLINGGDNLLRIVLFYLMFAQLDARLRFLRTRSGAGTPRSSSAQVVRTVLHNGALAACVLQLCVLYLSSALFKVQGRMWQEGTAVYYITRVAEYNAWPELSALIGQSVVLVTVGTYAAVFVQMAFPFALFNRYTRHLVFLLLVGMHLSIGLLMGLPVFSLTMLAVDLLLFTDDEWRRGAARLQAARTRLAEARRSTARPEPVSAPAAVPAHASALTVPVTTMEVAR